MGKRAKGRHERQAPGGARAVEAGGTSRRGLGSGPRLALLAAVLALVTLYAFSGVLSSGFLNFDDDLYVTENARVRAGLTWDSVKWACGNLDLGFYYPLTWLSHMADVELFGLDAGKHHATSLALHLLDALLLLLLLVRLTAAPWRSALVAALFALHPLHVESVAWISERKDVLSTLLWFLCLLAYARYAERPSVGRYLPVFALFLMGLMAKSMLVTLPLTLLLLDYWPLGRWPSGTQEPGAGERGRGLGRPATAGRLLLEKLPLLALVPLFVALTWVSQERLGAFAAVPFAQRVANAGLSYVAYLGKTFVPTDLVVFYPHPGAGISWGWAALGGLALLAATALAVGFGRGRRYLAVGWLWYLVTLLPVIGLVQVGKQGMADRYTYVPLVGLFLLMAWAAGDLVAWRPAARVWVAGASVLGLLVLVVLTRAQVRCWSDSETLFRHALAHGPATALSHCDLGIALFRKGQREEALSHLEEAVRLEPGFFFAQTNLANALSESGRPEEAIGHFREALRIQPDHDKSLSGLGVALMRTGRFQEALDTLERAAEVGPDPVGAGNLAVTVLLKAGRLPEAIDRSREILALHPDSVEARNNLGLAYAKSRRPQEAVEQFQEALRLAPGFTGARGNLGVVLQQSGRAREAVEQFELALEGQPDNAEFHNGLGLALLELGRAGEAAAHFESAVRVRPDFAVAVCNLGAAYAQLGRDPEAARCFERALELRPDLVGAREGLGRLRARPAGTTAP